MRSCVLTWDSVHQAFVCIRVGSLGLLEGHDLVPAVKHMRKLAVSGESEAVPSEQKKCELSVHLLGGQRC